MMTTLALSIISLLSAINTGEIITSLIESSPVVAICGLGLWYMHSQVKSKDAEIVTISKRNEGLVDRLIDDKEKRLLSENKHLNMLEKIIDKTGDIPAIIRQEVARLEENQRALREDIKELKNN